MLGICAFAATASAAGRTSDGMAEGDDLDVRKLKLNAGWGLSAGLQTSDNYTSVSTGPTVGLTYAVKKTVVLSAQLAPYVDLTRMPKNNRRLDMSSGFLRASFSNLFEERVTGIRLGGSATYNLPVALGDWRYGNPKLGQINAGLNLSRTFSDLRLTTGLSGTLPLHLNTRAELQCDPAEVAKVGASCPSYTHGGVYNTRFSLAGNLGASYSYGPWMGTARLGLTRGWTYGESSANEPHNTHDHANTRHSFLFGAGVTYNINDNWGVTGGFSNAGPQLTSRDGYNNFLFDKKFASVYLNVDWTQ